MVNPFSVRSSCCPAVFVESVLVEFIDHYNQARPHQGIEQGRPREPADVVPLPTGPVERRDRLGGIIIDKGRLPTPLDVRMSEMLLAFGRP